ncbi:MAG TPA: hydrogenase formation protein HypD, partial [Euryarchaeota archaeon]|nr:hydrogenase formation protein HypD [Euryarchaeota archaeon]
GIGRVPFSKLEFRDEYFNADAMKRHSVKLKKSVDIPPGCSCHLVIIGKIEPEKCIMFGNQCTPEKPFGPCMVSSEGTCNIYYRYGSYA